MSYQRAIVNCKRCYAQSETRHGESFSLPKELLSGDSRAAEFRERAMQALELELDVCSTGTEFTVEELTRKTRRALTACMNCKYQKTEIAEIFQPVEEDGSV